jgi:hypothetical protein
MKICTLKAELFRADRRTDLMQLRVAFRSFANAPKNEHMLSLGTISGWVVWVQSELERSLLQ